MGEPGPEVLDTENPGLWMSSWMPTGLASQTQGLLCLWSQTSVLWGWDLKQGDPRAWVSDVGTLGPASWLQGPRGLGLRQQTAGPGSQMWGPLTGSWTQSFRRGGVPRAWSQKWQTVGPASQMGGTWNLVSPPVALRASIPRTDWGRCWEVTGRMLGSPSRSSLLCPQTRAMV